jgi:hypothetical protein
MGIFLFAEVFTGNLAAQQVQQKRAPNMPKEAELSDWMHLTI